MRFMCLTACAAMISCHALGQTQVDLQKQGRNVDFSLASTTKPVKIGTQLPAVCAVGELFLKLDAQPGGNLYACTTQNAWVAQAQSTSGGGGGGSSSGGIPAILNVTRTSATTLSVGDGCAAATPCNVRFGSLLLSFTQNATATISAGTGTAYFYVSANGVLTVGHSMTVSCVGCVAQSGISAFPTDAIPLFTWTATTTSGAWDTQGSDARAFLAAKNITVTSGLTSLEGSGQTILGVDPTVIGFLVATPSSSSAGCSAGSWSFDSSFFYVCVAANTWRRMGISTW